MKIIYIYIIKLLKIRLNKNINKNKIKTYYRLQLKCINNINITRKIMKYKVLYIVFCFNVSYPIREKVDLIKGELIFEKILYFYKNKFNIFHSFNVEFCLICTFFTIEYK